MPKKKLVKLGLLTLGLGSLIAVSRPVTAATFCCSTCDTLFETCTTNFPHNLQNCIKAHDNCLQTCNPSC